MLQFILCLILIQPSLLRRHKEERYQTTIDGECYQGYKDEFPHGLKLKLVTHNECKHYTGIGELYRYGNWCGKDYGGFNNDCKEICLADISNPSEECIRCNRPKDYVDEQCMYHDFCVERFQLGLQGDGTSCDTSFNLGNPFPSPCICPMNITEHLKYNQLAIFCNDEDCLINGALIQAVFGSVILSCSCSYAVCNNNTIDNNGNPIPSGDPLECHNRTACVSADQCTALGGM